MFLTEEEAAKKWCPRRFYADYQPDKNIYVTANVGATCIGSACMMWDWIDSEVEINRDHFIRDTAPVADEKGPWSWDDARRRWVRPHPARRGRCGLRSEIPDV